MKLQQRGSWTFVRGLMLVAFVAAALSACAERFGKQAAAGAMAEMQKERASSADDPNKQVVRIAGQRAVEGVVEALDAPEQRAAIQRMVSEAVSVAAATAVEEATRHMIAQLGPDGRGAARGQPGADERAGLRGGRRGGHERHGTRARRPVPRVQRPGPPGVHRAAVPAGARTTAASFTSGVNDSIGWRLLLLMFVLGAGGGVLGAWLWSLRHVRRREFRTA